MDPRKKAVVAAVAGAVWTLLASGCGGGARPAAPAALSPLPTSAQAPTTVSTTTIAPVAETTTTPVPARAVSTVPVPVSATASTTRPPAPTSPPPCPSSLPTELASTGAARQLITVVAAGWDTSVATVQLWERSGRCWRSAGGPWTGFIGENGFSDHHIEGDGTTPTGVYGVGPVMYGNAPNPGVRETYHLIVCGDWWDEDPRSAEYNTFQHVPCDSAGQSNPPFGGGSEALWKEQDPYPSFAVIDYNTGPIVKGAGSAVFLHADTGGPTSGCVSVPLADLDQALRWIDPAQDPAFVMGPAGEIDRF